jgi:hypothetical protein
MDPNVSQSINNKKKIYLMLVALPIVDQCIWLNTTTKSFPYFSQKWLLDEIFSEEYPKRINVQKL